MADKLILNIEDNELNSKLMRDLMQFNGYKTLESITAEEGIKIAQEKLPDLILMDFELPGMNGMEAFKILRADPLTAAIPIIAVTASAMVEEQQMMLKVGFDGLHTKPIHVKTFLASIKTYLEKQKEEK